MLRDGGIPYEYESTKLRYVVPESEHVYTPDFVVGDTFEVDIYLETKGKFTPADRKKMLHVLASNQDKLIMMVFPAPNNKLRKGSSTTYAGWCDKHGVPWISVKDLEQTLKHKDFYDHLQQRARRVGLPRSNRGRKGSAHDPG